METNYLSCHLKSTSTTSVFVNKDFTYNITISHLHWSVHKWALLLLDVLCYYQVLDIDRAECLMMLSQKNKTQQVIVIVQRRNCISAVFVWLLFCIPFLSWKWNYQNQVHLSWLRALRTLIKDHCSCQLYFV